MVKIRYSALIKIKWISWGGKDERAKFVAAFEKLEANTSKGYHLFVEKSLEKFKKLNNIKKENIIEIAFDAIWIDKEVYNLQVTENIRFTCKRKASAILEIGKVKFYFNSTDNTFFQRGLGKKESPWFEIIKEYMSLSEIEDTENLNKFIFDFKEKYTNKKLDKEFYKRLIAKMDNIELLKNLYWQRLKNRLEYSGKKIDIPL